jgi:outer membrane lipase/esterase
MRRSNQLAVFIASSCIATIAGAANYSDTVFFGDSLTDAGTYAAIVQSFYPGTGKFTTNPGPVWSENLAAELGTEARPAVDGGTNYAAGGARVTKNPGYPYSTPFIANAPAIRTQISSYLDANGGRADPNALFSVWAGANDLFALEAPEANTQYLADSMPQVAGELTEQVARLKTAGARQVIVFSLPDIGATPDSVGDGPAAAALSTAHSVEYNRELFTQLAARGISVIPIDTFNLLRMVVADPTRFGFSNASSTACDLNQVSSSLICNSSNYPAGSDQSYVFADGNHPTTATHRLISEYVVGLLAAPQQINALPTGAVASRAALHELLRTQLFAGELQRKRDGRHVWVTVQGQQREYDTAKLDPNDDASGYQFALGFDMPLSEDWVVGGALSVGRDSVDFAAQRGDYAQRDATLSAYGKWRAQSWFVDGAASYGVQDYDINRRIPLGTSALAPDGDTSGNNFSLQLEGGYEFSSGAITHGPYLGAVAQEVRIDSFEEEGGEAANLGYAAQKRHSLVGSAGWQLAYAAGSWSPYARLGAEHEFEDRDHSLELRALSIPEALSFRMPVTDPERTRYPLQLGISGELPNLAGYNIGITHSFSKDDSDSTRFYAGFSAKF